MCTCPGRFAGFRAFVSFMPQASLIETPRVWEFGQLTQGVELGLLFGERIRPQQAFRSGKVATLQ